MTRPAQSGAAKSGASPQTVLSAEDDRSSTYGRSADIAANAIRSMIMLGEIETGAHLKQDVVATKIGVTRVPVREAFKMLTSDGVLRYERNRGYFVTELRSAQLRQMLWLRATIEDEVLRSIQQPTERQVEHLRILNSRVAAHSDRDKYDYPSVLEADRCFHSAIWDLSPNEVLVRELRRVFGFVRPYRVFMPLANPDAVVLSVAEHEQMVSLLADGDLDGFRQALVAHRSVAYRVVDELAAEERAR